MKLNKWIVSLAMAVAISSIGSVSAAEKLSLDELLKQVKTGKQADAKENKAREARFRAEKAQQQNILAAEKAKRNRLEAKSAEMEAEFDANEKLLGESQETLKIRLGSLKELFGVLQQAAGDAKGQFDNSITQIQFPDRSVFLEGLAKKMGESSQLASIDDIERLWFELQREMTESGRVVKVPVEVITADGSKEQRDVTRIGVFNLVADGKYLNYVPETGHVAELARQPKARFLKGAEALEAATSGITPVGIDPSRGQILSLLVQSPSLIERVHQGGLVGYVIIGLGVFAAVLAVLLMLILIFTGLKVSSQRKHQDKPKKSNPLGRILLAYHENTDANVETLELKLGEAILRESPKLTRGVMWLKIIFMVAPLLGLLGTVTGMIVTFQAITLFGTGDPKLMAGGISQALVTTVLGLSVAIPTVLLHTMVNSRSRAIQQVLEEQSAGMVATFAEQYGKPSAKT